MTSSTSGSRTRMSARERRELVLAAAARRFAADGYDGTTIERIAREAGVTKPIVYRHFDSKKDLYLTLLSKHRDDLPSFLEGIDLTAGLAAGSLRLVLERWFRYVEVHAHAWVMLFRDRGGDAEIQEFRLGVTARAREVMAGLIEASESGLPAQQVVPAAETLRSGLAGLALWSIDHPEVEGGDLVEVAMRIAAAAFGLPTTPVAHC